MKKSVLAALTLALFSGSAAFAADPYSRGSTKDAPVAVVGGVDKVNWTGFYIGGALGYGNANHELSVQSFFENYCASNGDTEVGFDENGNFDPNGWKTVANKKAEWPTITGDSCETLAKSPEAKRSFPSGSHFTVPGDSREIANIDGINSSGLVGDGRIGFDLQRGRFVFGLYGSYGLNDMETSASVNLGGLGGSASIEKGEEWSVGGRAGLLVNPRTLAYILAAYTQTDYEFGVAGFGGAESREITFDGITVGGGVEFALTQNVFLGIEGTHTFYGEETIFSAYDAGDNQGVRLTDTIGETKVMGTLKIKLNTDLGVNLD